MDENTQINLGTAYQAMFAFVDAFWERGGKQDDDISNMLSVMQFGIDGPTKTADPAQWNDFLDAVKKVKS